MSITTDASHAAAAAGYVAACVVVSSIAVPMLKETADKPID